MRQIYKSHDTNGHVKDIQVVDLTTSIHDDPITKSGKINYINTTLNKMDRSRRFELTPNPFKIGTIAN